MRYQLRSRTALTYLMGSPGRGAPYNTRSLAAAARVSPAVIGRLQTGRRPTVTPQAAHRIAEALGVALLVLFVPPASPNPTKEDPTQTDEEVDPWAETDASPRRA